MLSTAPDDEDRLGGANRADRDADCAKCARFAGEVIEADTRRFHSLARQPEWGGASLRTLFENSSLRHQVLLRSAAGEGHLRAYPSHEQAADELDEGQALELSEVIGPRTESLVHVLVELDQQSAGLDDWSFDLSNEEDRQRFYSDAVDWTIAFLGEHYSVPVPRADLLCASVDEIVGVRLLIVAPYVLRDGEERMELKRQVMASDQGKSVTPDNVQVVADGLYSGDFQTMPAALGALRPLRRLPRGELAPWGEGAREQILQGMVSYNALARAGGSYLPEPVEVRARPDSKRARRVGRGDELLSEYEQLNRDKTAALGEILRSVGDCTSRIVRWESSTSVYMGSPCLPVHSMEDAGTANDRRLLLREFVDKRLLARIIAQREADLACARGCPGEESGGAEYSLGRCRVRGKEAGPYNQLTLLKRYYGRLDEWGSCVMPYHQQEHSGRYFVSVGYGIQNMSRAVRHTVCGGLYWDVDMANAHPTLLSFYCRQHGIPCDCLDRYITDREGMLRELQAARHCGRDEAKQEYIAVLNGKAVPDVGQLPPRYRRYYEQCAAIREAVTAREHVHKRAAIRSKSARGGYNIEGTTTNYVMCDLENRCLMAVLDYLTGRGVRVDVLVFDGLMIHKTSCPEALLPSLLAGCSAEVRRVVGCDMQFTVKPMDQGLRLEGVDVEGLRLEGVDVEGVPERPPGDLFNWYVEIEDGRVYAKYSCLTAGATRFKIGTMPTLHDVWREHYEYVDGEGRPRVRPFYLDGTTKPFILECTTCGGGKTHQTIACIERDHSPRTTRAADGHPIVMAAAMGGRVIVILHRRQLCLAFFRALEARGCEFDLYLQQPVRDISSTRLVVCVNSLHKVRNDQWDLVVIDEMPEVLDAVCTMDSGHCGVLKLAVNRKLCSFLSSTRRAILLSANNDQSVHEYLREIKRADHAQWQMNGARIHGGTEYEILYVSPPAEIKNDEAATLSREIALREICDRLDGGLNLVIPCAEVADLEALLATLVERYGEQDRDGKPNFIAVSGPMTAEEKEANIARIQCDSCRQSPARDPLICTCRRYRAVLFSSCLDCGHSFENWDLHYDLVMVRLHNRSISACVAFQLAWRFRRTRQNRIIFLCDPGMRDYQERPGYTHKSVNEVEPGLLLPCPDAEAGRWRSLDVCKRWLDLNCASHLAEEYHVETGRGKYSLLRRPPLRRMTLRQAQEELSSAAQVQQLLRDARSDSSLQLSDSVRTMLREGRTMSMAHLFRENRGLLRRMARVLRDEVNLRSSLMPELKRQIALTGAVVPQPEFLTLPESEETQLADDFMEAGAEREQEETNSRCSSILAPTSNVHAAFGPMDTLRAAVAEVEQGGNYVLDAELRRQVRLVHDKRPAFLALCRYSCVRLPATHPQHCADVETLMEKDLAVCAERDPWEFVELRSHTPMQMRLLQRMLRACEFRDMFDRSSQRVHPTKDMWKIRELDGLLQEYRKTKSRRRAGKPPQQTLHAVSEALSHALCVRISPADGERADRNGHMYRISMIKGAEHWPEPEYSRYESWCEFVQSERAGSQ